MIHIENLSKIYKNNTNALNSITLNIHKNAITGIIGENGAGKTTLLKLLAGLQAPTSGIITINNLSLEENLLEMKEKIGFIPETPVIKSNFSVIEQISFYISLYEKDITKQQELFSYLIKTLSLQEVLSKKISTLSKGYLQRISFAQALIKKPEILILDEPITGLDPIQINDIRSLLVNLKKTTTIILSTHILQEIETLCDSIIILSKGNLIASGTEEQICTLTNKKNILDAFYTLKK